MIGIIALITLITRVEIAVLGTDDVVSPPKLVVTSVTIPVAGTNVSVLVADFAVLGTDNVVSSANLAGLGMNKTVFLS